MSGGAALSVEKRSRRRCCTLAWSGCCCALVLFTIWGQYVPYGTGVPVKTKARLKLGSRTRSPPNNKITNRKQTNGRGVSDGLYI